MLRIFEICDELYDKEIYHHQEIVVKMRDGTKVIHTTMRLRENYGQITLIIKRTLEWDAYRLTRIL